MVLKEIDILNKNSKLIIIGAMILGAVYPFFSDLDLPISPKYILIGVSVLGIVLFWEVYGEKKYQEQSPSTTRQPIQPTMPYQQPYPPQFQQPYNPYPQQQYPQYQQSQYVNPQIPIEPQHHRQYPYQYPPQKPQHKETPTEFEMFSDYAEEPVERYKLPRLSDVAKGKAKLPDKIPTPKDVYEKKSQRSSFEKFGIKDE